MKSIPMRLALALPMLVAMPLGAFAGDFAIDWFSIDGGGEMSSSGGGFELAGTIGQHDASTTVMTGGSFELTGGFWQVFADPCGAGLCGDANCDGIFNGGDIDPFFEALGDPVAWQANHPGCGLLCVADINHDGLVNGGDIDPFFRALGAGSCP